MYTNAINSQRKIHWLNSAPLHVSVPRGEQEDLKSSANIVYISTLVIYNNIGSDKM